ncbi:MAG: GIY-YIG nuclease family protein [Candidatus Omnitrophica bacterium]|nr:GIY-YIG nuclease family protein [Candidatus Omnitrophota bacterium]MDD5771155.1 GIY-YIG nuclease family protein [Candidatus Omnitrophota bacterium]
MYYVYALKSVKHNRIYIGFTTKLDTRIKEHNSGQTKSTRFYRPWKLFYYKELNSRNEARKEEKKLKSGSGREFLKRMVIAPVAHKDRAAVS